MDPNYRALHLDYTPAGMEKGSPSFDIGQILTRHEQFDQPCAKVLDLRRTVGHNMKAAQRLASVQIVACTCGAGDSPSERTSI